MMNQGAQEAKVTEARRSALIDGANTLANARRTKNPIPELDERLRPTDEFEAYLMQDELAVAFGEVGGWKVGASSPTATPTMAPMPRLWTAASGTEFRALRYRAVEAEIAFRLGTALPTRSQPYSREEVMEAVESCHPAVEILDSAFEDPSRVDRLSGLADLIFHGGFCYGAAFAGWRSFDFAQERVTLSIDGIVRVERTGSNTAGDLIGLVVWLANVGTSRVGGLKAGQWVTTGSWTGSLPAEVRSAVTVDFQNVGSVALQFAPEQNLEKGLPGVTRRFS